MAVDMTARARTPGARKSTGSSPSMGSTSTTREEDEQAHGDAEGEQQRLAPPQRQRGLDPGLGGQGGTAAHGRVLPGEAEEDVLEVLAAGPEVAQGQVALGQPGGQGGHGAGGGLGRHPVLAGGLLGDGGAESGGQAEHVESGGGAEADLGGRPALISSAGEPSATTRPRSTITTRSASFSASSRSWVASRTQTPASRCSVTTSPHQLAAVDVEAGGGLVEERHLGPTDQGQGEGQALLLAPRQAAGRGLGLVVQPHPAEQRSRFGGVVVVGGEEVEDLGGADAGVERRPPAASRRCGRRRWRDRPGGRGPGPGRGPRRAGGSPRGPRWSRSCPRRSVPAGPSPRPLRPRTTARRRRRRSP